MISKMKVRIFFWDGDGEYGMEEPVEKFSHIPLAVRVIMEALKRDYEFRHGEGTFKLE